MKYQESTPTQGLPSALVASTIGIQLFIAAALALTVLWGVTLSPSPTIHNAAHDVRHITGTPCH